WAFLAARRCRHVGSLPRARAVGPGDKCDRCRRLRRILASRTARSTGYYREYRSIRMGASSITTVLISLALLRCLSTGSQLQVGDQPMEVVRMQPQEPGCGVIVTAGFVHRAQNEVLLGLP